MTFVKYNRPQVSRKPILADFFDEFFGNINDIARPTVLGPKVNISETTEAHILELTAPGRAKEDFDINIEKDTMTISSKQESTETAEEKNFIRKEFSVKSFSRSFTLPESVNTEDISAKYENGILSITLPKKEEAKELPPKKVDIL